MVQPIRKKLSQLSNRSEEKVHPSKVHLERFERECWQLKLKRIEIKSHGTSSYHQLVLGWILWIFIKNNFKYLNNLFYQSIYKSIIKLVIGLSVDTFVLIKDEVMADNIHLIFKPRKTNNHIQKLDLKIVVTIMLTIQIV